MVAAVALRADIHILADFNVPLRADDDGAPVAPRPQAVRREPVHAEVERRAVCTVDGAVAEVIQLRILRMRVVGNAAAGDCAVLLARIEQILLDLVAADIAEDAAVLLLFKEPLRPPCRAQPMRPEALHMDDLADGALLNQVARQHRAFHMQPFAVIDHVLLARLRHHLLGAVQLLQGGEGRFVGEVVLARLHGAQPQRTALVCNRRAADHVRFFVVKQFFLAPGDFHLRVRFYERFHLLRVGVVDVLQRAARFQQAVRHAVDVPVVKVRGRKDKFTRLHDGLRLAFGRIIHAV